MVFTIAPGSVKVRGEVQISSDAGNTLSIGTDAKLVAADVVTTIELVGSDLHYTDKLGGLPIVPMGVGIG